MLTCTINDLFLRLSAWPLATEQPTLVMLHGSGNTGVLWDAQITGLADIANVVAVDLPGHGGSQGAAAASVSEYAAGIAALIPALGISRAIVCGLSLGGGIALQMLLDHAERVAGAVLLGTGARLRVMPMIFQLIEHDFESFVQGMPGVAASPNTDAALLAPLMRSVLDNGAEVTAGDFRVCDAFDVMDRLGEIDSPVLVLSGDDDKLTPAKYSNYLGNQIAGAELVTLSDAGHLAAVERPDAVNQAIRTWLLGLSG